MKNHKKDGIVNQIWSVFASVKLTIFLLILLAVLSIVGTLIPQNSNPDFYFHKYGESLYNLFSALQIFDIYHSPWFRLLITALVANIIVCSIDRLSSVWKIIFPKQPKFSSASFKNAPGKDDFTVSQTADALKTDFSEFISRRFRYSRIEKTETGYFIFAEKGRRTRLGVYAVHLSVVLLLSGSLVGSILGFDGFVTIPEGETIDHIQLTNTHKTIPLGFAVKCDDFNVKFYKSGAPEEFRSSLSIIENNTITLQQDILVNHPLRYKGINIFQSSYGTFEPRDISLNLYQISTQNIFPYKMNINDTITLPDQMGHFTLTGYTPDFHMMGQSMGQAFTGTLTLKDKDPVEVIIPHPFPEIDFKNPKHIEQLSMLQSSKPTRLPKEISVTFTSKATGMVYTRKTAVDEEMEIPEGLGKLKITELKKSYSFMGRNLGDAVIGLLTPASGQPEKIFLPVKFPGFDRMRQGNVAITLSENDFQKKNVSSDLIVYVAGYENRYYTGLQVTRDPGVGIVYAGFIMMIIGCYITFFMSHKKLCIELNRQDNVTRVSVAGTANKNKLGMETYTKKISDRLKART